MTAPIRIPTTPDVIYTAIVDLLVAAEVFAESCCFLATDNEKAKSVPPSTLYGVVKPGRWRTDQRATAGGGRNMVQVEQDISVVILCKNYLDQGDRATALLTGTNSITAKATQVMDALHCVDLLAPDESGNGLLCEPMRALGGDIEAHPGKTAEETIDFQVKFLWGLPSTYASAVF